MNRKTKMLLALVLVVAAFVGGYASQVRQPVLTAEASALAAVLKPKAEEVERVVARQVPASHSTTTERTPQMAALVASVNQAPAESRQALVAATMETLEFWCANGIDPVWPGGVKWDLFRVWVGGKEVILRCTEPGRCRPGQAYHIPGTRVWVPLQGECQVLLECPACTCEGTATSTATATQTATSTSTGTTTMTPTATATGTGTGSPTHTPTTTPTASATATGTATEKPTATLQPTATATLSEPPTKVPPPTPIVDCHEPVSFTAPMSMEPHVFGTLITTPGNGFTEYLGAQNESFRGTSVDECQYFVGNAWRLDADRNNPSIGTINGPCVAFWHRGAGTIEINVSDGVIHHVDMRRTGASLNEGLAQMRDTLLKMRFPPGHAQAGQPVCSFEQIKWIELTGR